MSNVSSGLVDPIHRFSSPSGSFKDALMKHLSDVMSCHHISEVIENVGCVLEDSGSTRISVWKSHSNGSSILDTTTSKSELFPEIQSSERPTLQPIYKTSMVQLLRDQDDILALVRFERSLPFETSECEIIAWFVQTLNTHIRNITKHRSSVLIELLSKMLNPTQERETIASIALEVLSKEFGLSFGTLLIQQGGHFCPIASYGSLDKTFLATTYPVTTSWLKPSYHRGEIIYSEPHVSLYHSEELPGKLESYIICPLGDTLPRRFILVLGSETSKRWLNYEKTTLASVCRVLDMALRYTESQTRLKTLMSLQQHSLTDSESPLLHHVLQAAVQIVPGAEGGSLLIRQGKRFYFHAAIGYDFETMKSFSFKSKEMLYWHHPERSRWNSMEPRIFNKKESVQKHILEGATLSPAFREVGRVDEIQSNLYFPIIENGTVLAVLNLDNFHDTDAFAEDSLNAARMFGSPVAHLLRERRYRYLLERDSLTDPLTNLANRRAFDQTLMRETVRSDRFNIPMSLLMLDLGKFKQINDTFGHSHGDAVLIEVAKTLKLVIRTSDYVFRWGGDEFAIVLTNTGYEGAVVAARRCARAIKRMAKKNISIDVHIGVASYPSCAASQTKLLRLADERLYKAKEHDITVYLSQSYLEQQNPDPSLFSRNHSIND